MTIRAAADGSALGNPGPAGWSWYVDDSSWSAGGWKHATNNQGELMAVLQLFRATAHLDEDLLILCDSQYVINCVSKWMPGWKKKGWRKADGKPVMNVELLQEIDAALVGRRYRFEWVKGHANHPLNEAADARARAAAEAYQRGAAVIPSGPGFTRAGDAVVAPPEVAWRPGGAGAQAATQAAVPAPASDPTRSAVAAPTLFAFDDAPDDAPVAVTATLTPAQHERLRAIAARDGVTVEQALARLIP